MKNESGSLEKVMRVWDDQYGTRLEVSEDSDGLGLMEIKYIDEKGKKHDRIVFSKEQTPLLKKALDEVYIFLKARDDV